jgi:hypothetical protein
MTTESYEGLDIGKQAIHDGIRMRVLKTHQDKSTCESFKGEYSGEGYYCVVVKRDKNIFYYNEEDYETKECKHPYYALIGVKVKDLQDEIDEMRKVNRIKMEFLKELFDFRGIERGVERALIDGIGHINFIDQTPFHNIRHSGFGSIRRTLF